MKIKIMKKTVILFIITLCVHNVSGQIIFKDNFDYPSGALTNIHANPLEPGAWWAFASPGVEPVQVIEGGLVFDGYNFSDADGKAIRLNPTKQGTEDITVQFTQRVVDPDATLYFAFLLKINETIPTTNTAPTQFLQLVSSTRNTQRANLIAIENSPTTYKLRIRWGLNHSVYRETTKEYTYGETYLVVLKYQRGPSGTSNQDVTSLYTFNSTPPMTEPSIPDTEAFGDAGTIDPLYVNLYQNGPTSAPTTTVPQDMTIDGMVAALSWRDIFREGQPVGNFNDITIETGSDPVIFDASVKSGNPITYHIEGGKEDVATLDGNALTIVGQGSVKITAKADGTEDLMAAEKTITVRVVASFDWLKSPAIAVAGNNVRVTGPGAERFTKIYINDTETTDLTSFSGDITLRATTDDGSEVIRLIINR